MEKKQYIQQKEKHKTLDELEEKYYGKIGTPKRDLYELELTMDILAEKIKELRLQKQLTQEELGIKLGVQKAQISKLEKGNNSANLSTILKVFQAMNAKILFKVEFDKTGKLAALLK